MTDSGFFSWVEETPYFEGDIYHHYKTPFGVSGLMECEGNRVSFLVIESQHPGTGQCRKFIAQAQNRFEEIRVLVVFDSILREALIRYGFKPRIEGCDTNYVRTRKKD